MKARWSRSTRTPATCGRWWAGASFESSQFNRAIQAKRQPGSAFKPFVFAAALEQGWSPASVIDRLDEPIQTLQGAWMPEDEHATTPSMTLRTALRTSSNRAAVRLLEEVGIPPTVATPSTWAWAWSRACRRWRSGTGEVTLEGMTAAYATFASAGVIARRSSSAASKTATGR